MKLWNDVSSASEIWRPKIKGGESATTKWPQKHEDGKLKRRDLWERARRYAAIFAVSLLLIYASLMAVCFVIDPHLYTFYSILVRAFVLVLIAAAVGFAIAVIPVRDE